MTEWMLRLVGPIFTELMSHQLAFRRQARDRDGLDDDEVALIIEEAIRCADELYTNTVGFTEKKQRGLK